MANPPAYQYYPKSFDGDTAAWTNEEVGIYQRLLNYSWVNGWNPNEGLPDDPKRLANIVRCSYKKFQKRWEIISKKFSKNGHGFLINERLEEEREKQRLYREGQSESGKRGIEAKKKKGIFPFDKSNNPSSDASSKLSTDPPSENQALHLQSSYKEKDIQFSFPLRDKNKSYILGSEKIKEYQKTYQNIDMIQELKDCVQWNKDNKDKRKTEQGILRHIHKWLSKASKDKGYIARAQDPDLKAQQERDEIDKQYTPEQLRKNKVRLGELVKGVVNKV